VLPKHRDDYSTVTRTKRERITLLTVADIPSRAFGLQ
jgi:hypothetical protein